MSRADVPRFIADKLIAIHDHIGKIDLLNEKDAKFETTAESLVNRCKTDCDVFQETPHLLDPRLDSFVKKLTDAVIKYKDVSKRKMDLSFSLLYLITKVRGYKTVIRHLPHEVQHMSLVMDLLSQQQISSSNWETRYMLLLWLSVLCLIPLDLKRFDTGNESETLIQR